MAVFCGIDWAEGHHDIALVDGEGKLLAKPRIEENLDGVAQFTAMLAAADDSAEDPIPVAIETPRGLLVAVLRASGRPIYPMNPLAVARYRERTSVSGKKSGHVDAMALANPAHRCASAPDAARGQRVGPLDHGAGQSITSFPGLGDVSGAIVLAEIGDDRDRFTDDRGLQAFAGSAPVTGESRTVTRRRTKNNRLAGIGTPGRSPPPHGPRRRVSTTCRRRERGDGHPAALRHLFNRMLGQLHHCLQAEQTAGVIAAAVLALAVAFLTRMAMINSAAHSAADSDQ